MNPTRATIIKGTKRLKIASVAVGLSSLTNPRRVQG
jgi:hypothetical protein